MDTDAGMGTSSQSSTTRKVLVRVGANSRVVTLESDADVNAAIVGAFSDVPRVRDASSFVIQMKDVEWGEFIDLAEGQAIPDRAVLNVVPQVGNILKMKLCI